LFYHFYALKLLANYISENEKMNHKNSKGFKRVAKAAVYSSQGIRAAFQNEAAFRQEVLFALIMIPVAFLLDVDGTYRLLMVSSILGVLVVELLNTAIEAIVDRIGPEFHELAGRAKDTGSAAVLISIMISAYIWIEALWASYF
jgi:diacylglycerol kinase (ATP)